MNSRFHKKQAEALIMQANESTAQYGGHDGAYVTYLIRMAQIHATLANVPDEYDGDMGPN